MYNIYHIWVFPKIGVPQNGWFIRENPIKMDDLGVPLFSETSIYNSMYKMWPPDSSNMYWSPSFLEVFQHCLGKPPCTVVPRWNLQLAQYPKGNCWSRDCWNPFRNPKNTTSGNGWLFLTWIYHGRFQHPQPPPPKKEQGAPTRWKSLKTWEKVKKKDT